MIFTLLGIFGTLALIVAWLWASYEDVKEHKRAIDLNFSILYIFGNALLLVYSWWLKNFVYIILQLFLVVAISVETMYALKQGRVGKKRRKKK